MPRKNRTPPHTRYQPTSASAPQKKRFATKQSAETALRELKKYHLDLELTIYQSPVDGGWYLTSQHTGIDSSWEN